MSNRVYTSQRLGVAPDRPSAVVLPPGKKSCMKPVQYSIVYLPSVWVWSDSDGSESDFSAISELSVELLEKKPEESDVGDNNSLNHSTGV